MSASNWTICPRCRDRAEDEANARIDAAAQAYGNVPAEEYERLRAEALPFDASALKPTFREDYEFYGAETGTVKLSYSGHCLTCGLNSDFTDEREFYKREASAA